MPGPVLVQNPINESVPGASTVRLAMDFGNITEILAGGEIDSCTISFVSNTATPVTLVPDSIVIESGYLVSALFTGGSVGTVYVKFTPTLTTGQTLPSRTGALNLQ